MELKDRIKRFSDSIGFSIREFERACGLTRGNISNMTGALGSDKLAKIVDTHPELNVYWLLTGKGEMTREEQYIQAPSSNIYERDSRDAEVIAAKDLIIKRDAELIDSLQHRIRDLESRGIGHSAVLGSARSADTTPETGSQHPRK